MALPTVLMVAEKPSVAAAIASIVSHGNMTTERRDCCKACVVHTFVAPFQGRQTRYKVTSVVGHVYTTDFDQKYQSWTGTDPMTLFTCPTRKIESAKNGVTRLLQLEARGCSALVLWLDCDREGENICFEVMENVVPNMLPRAKVLRARFSAITAPDIAHALANLVAPNENEARSVDARQEIDLRVGVAFTRYQTLYFQDRYGDLDSRLISFGPCQTPTLGFCVARHDEIQAFQPEPYWFVKPVVDVRGYPAAPQWARGRVFDRQAAQLFLKLVGGAKTARVEEAKVAEARKPRPVPLNTVELLKVASRQLHMGPAHVMAVAEGLYTSGFISYPRTESTRYPEHFDLRAVLEQHAQHPLWGRHVCQLLADGLATPKAGVDAGDHPPITPTSAATEEQLGGDAWQLYEYICRHFIASVSPDCRTLKSKLVLAIGGERFKLSGHRVVAPGFAEVMPWLRPADDSMPDVTGLPSELPVQSVKLVEGRTSPPDYLTEAELIGLMEHHGIGTDASIPVHINNICSRNFCQVDPYTRTVTPTKLGITLVHGYYRIDPELVLPAVRANIEENIALIAQGHAPYDVVVKHALAQFQAKFAYFMERIVLMDELFGATFSKIAGTDGKMLCHCGRCQRYMTHISLKPERLYCHHCEETYSLPQNGAIREYPEEYCPVDGFQLVTYSTGTAKDGRTHALCPECYNRAPLPDMEDNCCCNKCPHTTCPHSMVSRGIRRCTQCDGGIICLEPPSTHGRWRASCNTCSRNVKFIKAVKSVKMSKHLCEKCGMRKILVVIGAPSTAEGAKQSKTAKAVAEAAASIDPKVAYCLKCDHQLKLCVKFSFMYGTTGFKKGRGGFSRGGFSRGGSARGRGGSRR